MINIIYGVIGFGLTYLVYLISVILRKSKLDKFKEKNSQLKYLIHAYKLDLSKMSIKKQANIIFLTNSFIVGITLFISSYFIDNLIKLLMIAFLSLFPLILISYFILGKCLQGKYGQK